MTKLIWAGGHDITESSTANEAFTWDFGDGTTVTSSASTISHVYKEPGKFFPKLFLEDTLLNCRVAIFGTDTITVSQATSYIKTNQNLFCDSASLQFFDSSRLQYDTITSYSWSFGDGTFSNNSNPVHSYVDTGLYPVSLIIKTRGGCTDTSANSLIRIVKSPRVLVTGPSATCVNVPVSFLGSVQSDSSRIKWNWDFGNGGSSTDATPGSQNYSVAGSYLVKATVTDTSGCINSDTSTLVVHPLPNLNAGADTAICYGTSITLRPTGANSYVWVGNPTLSCTSCATPVANPIDTSVYYVVTGTNAVGGCQQTDSINVKVVHPFKIAGMITDTLCIGESVKLSISGADSYNWSPAAGLSNANISNPVAAPVSTTLYTVIGHDYLNCFADTGYVPIEVYPIPVFSIAQDKITLSAGNSITINTASSDDITNWEWFPPTGLSCSNCPEPVTSANNTISYKATVTNGGGCRAEDKVTVQVFCDKGNIFMPNTFSPNRDGINDVFFPRGKGIAGIRNLQIFSRSGVVVFQRSNIIINDPNAGWDGTYNGKPLESDVFVYQVDVICSTGQVFPVKGDISLVR